MPDNHLVSISRVGLVVANVTFLCHCRSHSSLLGFKQFESKEATKFMSSQTSNSSEQNAEVKATPNMAVIAEINFSVPIRRQQAPHTGIHCRRLQHDVNQVQPWALTVRSARLRAWTKRPLIWRKYQHATPKLPLQT